ncbi:hypothetical protein J2T09_002887 [Neorhizobium huautlense]|uniref:Porin n=1 Tax=Neorhizobium huautlense TaxID=67774 RepID=A0ABT9PUI0_9HYPH|nr:porin [Neorhizobium huautlense]MDP9838120.1 hypothetical protein [Neorhizobium huautlense]
MNIKSLLLGSAAALAAVSGAQAADAIVAAEPEPMEYVRVCDAFGTGYFYIPGTETCLKISGYVRVQVNGRSDFDIDGQPAVFRDIDQDGGYLTNTRGKLAFEAKSDTELGTLTSVINIEGNSNNGGGFALDETYIELGGLRVGHFYNYFDTGLPGETVLSDGGPLGTSDTMAAVRAFLGATDGLGYRADSMTLNDSIRYTFDGGAFQAYVQADAFFDGWKTEENGGDDAIGINAMIAGKFGGVSIDLFGAYEFDNEDGVIASTLTAELGPGTLGIIGIYSFGPSYYYDYAEWSIGAEYAIKVSDKLSITPGAQYWDNIIPTVSDYAGGSAWRVGVTADYEITTNLNLKATVNYTDVDVDLGGLGDGDRWDGFLRLQRSF